MVIGFDFDKVFINYPPFLPYNFVEFLYKGSTIFRKNRTKNTNLHYRFPGIIEQKLRASSHYPLFRKPITTNIDALKKIAKRKNGKTYLVSSRFSFLRHRTDVVLKKYKLSQYFDGIYFNYENKQPHVFKEQTIRKLKIDTYIDDDLDLAIYLSKKIPTLKIYWISEGRQTDKTIPNQITKINNLKELYKIIQK